MIRERIKDPTNNNRAAWAQAAVQEFVEQCGDSGEPRLNVQDLLCDLMHMCDVLKVDFDQLVQHARAHYHTEIGATEPDWGTDPSGKATKFEEF